MSVIELWMLLLASATSTLALPQTSPLQQREFITESTIELPGADACFQFLNSTWICSHTDGLGLLKNLELNATIVRMEPDMPVTTATCDWSGPWHLHTISHKGYICPWGLFRDWWLGTVGYAYDEPQLASTVYVLDTWTDIDHQQFGGRASRSPIFAGSKYYAAGRPSHGTHVAGLAGAGRYGVNQKALLVSVQVLDDKGFGLWSTIARGLDWVSRQPVRGVINMSIGGPQSGIIDSMVDRLSAAGWLIVAAAGNTGTNACLSSPCSAKGSLCVGATTEANQLASFSNRGKCVDVLAPGDSIVSIVPRNALAHMSGTSMAAPLVAGVWSLLPLVSRETLLSDYTQRIKHGQAETTEMLIYSKPRDTCTGPLIRLQQ